MSWRPSFAKGRSAKARSVEPRPERTVAPQGTGVVETQRVITQQSSGVPVSWIIIALLAAVVLYLAFTSEFMSQDGVRVLPESMSRISSEIKKYNRNDDNIVGEMYLSGAERVLSGELKTLRDFEDWKLQQEERDGKPEGPRQDNYREHFKPHLDTVSGSDVEPEELARVLKSIGEGMKQ